MGKRELKKQHKDINLNVIDLLAKLDPTEGNKFLPFFIKKIKSLEEESKPRKRKKNKKYPFNPLNSENIFQNLFSTFLLDMVGGSLNKVNLLAEFENHIKDNRIDNTDVSTYDTWKQIEMSVEVADIKLKEKELKNSTEEIFKNDEWLVIRPLSFESSKTYGANTKWCTTMENEKLYFYRYTKGGLIYVINRVNGEKYGFYNGFFDDSHVHELTVWNAVDDRIDSLMTDVPLDVMYLIKEAMQTQNYGMLSDEEKENYSKYLGTEKSMADLEDYEIEEQAVPQLIGALDSDWNAEVDFTNEMSEPSPGNVEHLRNMLTTMTEFDDDTSF